MLVFAPLSLASQQPVRANGGPCFGKGKEYRSLSQDRSIKRSSEKHADGGTDGA